MTIDAVELERLLAHYAHYFEAWSQVTKTPHVWFLDSVPLPDYRSANCALRLRVGQATGPEAESIVSDTVSHVIAHFRGRGLPVVVDVDMIAEAHGFGRELRRRGVTPVVGNTLLMHRTTNRACVVPTINATNEHLSLRQVSNDPDSPETREWIGLAGMEEEAEGNFVEAAFWRDVALREAVSPSCRLYLARWDGQAAAACQLFAGGDWAQIDSVATHPAFRRRGIASRLVAQAVEDALELNCTTTYLFTEQGGAGEQVYRRLGFETWGVNVLRRHIQW